MLRKFFIVLLLTTSLTSICQKQPTRQNRDEWFKEMRQYKHDFLAKELALTQEQREQFFELYDQMSQSTMKMYDEARRQEKELEKKGDAATDKEYLALARTMSDMKNREGAIEMAYFDKFKTILSPRQMVKLKKAERKFNRRMMTQHAKTRPDIKVKTKK